MANSNAVLVAELVNNEYTFGIEYIAPESIPEALNGESGFHVYHVRMLTELILRQLLKVSNDFGLTEEKGNFELCKGYAKKSQIFVLVIP